jgi:uncharacterized coiled-coil protein SlyX
MSDRIEKIEVRIAFLEQANAELSDALIRQQQEIKALREQLDTATQRFEAAQSAPTAYAPEDEKPPHY